MVFTIILFVILCLVAMGLSLWGQIGIWILAFRKSLVWGIASVLLWPAQLIFIILHWQDAKRFFLIQLSSVIPIFLAMTLLLTQAGKHSEFKTLKAFTPAPLQELAPPTPKATTSSTEFRRRPKETRTITSEGNITKKGDTEILAVEGVDPEEVLRLVMEEEAKEEPDFSSSEKHFGKLMVYSKPKNVRLFLNGKLIASKTPFTLKKLPANKEFRLTAKSAGYETKEHWFNLREKETKTIRMDLIRR